MSYAAVFEQNKRHGSTPYRDIHINIPTFVHIFLMWAAFLSARDLSLGLVSNHSQKSPSKITWFSRFVVDCGDIQRVCSKTETGWKRTTWFGEAYIVCSLFVMTAFFPYLQIYVKKIMFKNKVVPIPTQLKSDWCIH